MPVKKKMRAVIYCRLSRNRTGERSASTERQEKECRKLADARGWEVSTVEVDDDRSAYSGKPRPGYERILDAMQARTVDVVLAWAPDRLHRNPTELEQFIDLVESSGVEVATVQAGRVDLATPAGRMQARMLGSIARYESEHRSERTRLAHDALAAAGRWKGGRRPYGYLPVGDGQLEVVPEEAAVIREAVERVLAGEQVGAVANDFQRRGIPTVTGAEWRGQTLRRVVSSPTTAGRRVSKGEDIGPALWKPIVDAETVAAVNTVLARGTKRGPVARVALLSGGRLVCAKCEKPMRSARRDNRARIYRCMTCFAQVNADPVEQLIEADVIEVLATSSVPDVAPAAPPGESVDALEAELTELADDLGAGRITRAEWLAARSGLAARLEVARDRFAASVGHPTVAALTGPGAAAKWSAMDLSAKQAVLDALIVTVKLNRATKQGPRFDETRVAVEWRS